MKKILIMLVVAIIAMAGTASAYDANIWNEEGTAAVGNPIILQPGQTLVFSYHGANFAADNQTMPYSYDVQAIPGTGAAESDMTVSISKANFEPGTEDPYTDVGVITISLDENAPATGQWRVTVAAGQDANTLDVGSAARNFEIPEFPTIALPIAAILGLAFFMQRRKEE
ncbi:MAG: PEF-CTERM sorting domain-containing protein [Methanolobus sp.]|nr:PEF-CTERM sorting domain-containing protein [Methanolobus sp.]